MHDFLKATVSAELAQALSSLRGDLAGRAWEMGGLEMMRAYSDLADALIGRVYELAVLRPSTGSGWDQDDGQAQDDGRAAARHIAIAAVGGYGRREMSPFSDVDVAFIVDSEGEEAVEHAVKLAFRTLMNVTDAAGLKVGYSYRRADDVENLSLDTQTALLDARHVAGSRAVFDDFRAALGKAIVPAAFVAGHVRARAARDASEDTPFVVEPDVKESHGGLRSLHAARWVSQVAFGLDQDEVWDGLRARGILVDSEIEESLASTDFVCRVRNALHLIAGRALDTLSRDRAGEVAERLGFDTVGQFTSTYYVHAHQLWRVYHKVVAACLETELVLEPGMVARDGRLVILDRGLPRRDPSAILRAFRHARSHGIELARQAVDMIAACGFQQDGQGGRVFLDILSQPGAASALRSMADAGILQAVVPGFGDLMYLVPGDAAHRFTVGEHSLRAVQELENLFRDEADRFADVFSRIQNLEVLFLAVLLHDIGKLDGRGGHANTGAVRAREVAHGLGMPDEECAKVEFLVRNHLKMADTARLRDLHQPKTVRDFAAAVPDPRMLDMLFLLTLADGRSVGSRSWSEVQTRFLLELHERAASAIRSPDAARPDIDRHRSRVRRELTLANIPEDEVAEHCECMPASYLLNTPPEDLAAHIGYVRSVRRGSPAVELKNDSAGEFSVLTVAALNKPGLLSEIAGVLHALGVDIHAAQVFTRHSSDQIAIDTLHIDFEGRQLTEMKRREVEGELLNVLRDHVTVGELLRRRRMGEFRLLGEVSLRALENLSDHQTVVEIRTPDTPGLLHHLTRAISEHGLDIHSARIATWGHEARDVFYVTDRAGGQPGPDALETLRRAVSV